MQWTPDGVADQKPVGERAVVVRAIRADGEELRRGMNQQHIVFADATSENLSFRDRFQRDASCQISCRLAVAHIALLTARDACKASTQPFSE